MQSAILVTAHGYPDNSVANVFLGSLKQSGYDGDLVLFSNDMTLDYPNLIQRPWNEDKTYFRSSRRLFSYYEFLKQSPIKYDQVITSGIRDVYFQKNPQTMPFKYASIYREPDGPTLGSCPYNSLWLKNSGYMGGLENKGIICAEIMVGTHEGLQHLLGRMLHEARINPRKYDLEDQAILNYMYWNNKLPFTTLYHNEKSPVYTVGYEPFIRFSKGQIVNASMEPIHICHQYDRHIQFGY